MEMGSSSMDYNCRRCFCSNSTDEFMVNDEENSTEFVTLSSGDVYDDTSENPVTDNGPNSDSEPVSEKTQQNKSAFLAISNFILVTCCTISSFVFKLNTF